MPPDAADPAYLWDMLDAARSVQQFVAGQSFDDYVASRMLRNAVERAVEIIGEAARKVSEAFKAEHPENPWPQIISQRHVLAHEYGYIRPNLMWEVATVHIPELIVKLERHLPPSPEP